MKPNLAGPDRDALILFAKVPGTPVKTRIAATRGREAANGIYLELLHHVASVLSGLPFHVAFAGSVEAGDLEGILVGANSFFPQCEGDLGLRMRSACERFADRGGEYFCVIGSDCPGLCKEDIHATFRVLHQGWDVVLGPAEDGGYYLAGVNVRGLAIFKATKWSRGDLLDETLELAGHHDLKYTTITRRFDIDTIEDYRRWKELL